MPPEGQVVETAADALWRMAVQEPLLLEEWESALHEWNEARGSYGYMEAASSPWGKEAAQRAFLVAYEIFGTISRAARRVGLHPHIVYRWGSTDQQFAEAFRVAELGLSDRLTERDLSRALSPLAEMDSASAGISARLLKSLRPLQHRDSAPLAMPNVPTSSIDFGEGNPNPYVGAVARTEATPQLSAPQEQP